MNSMYDALSIFSASGMFTFKIGHLKLQVRIKSCRMLDLLLLCKLFNVSATTRMCVYRFIINFGLLRCLVIHDWCGWLVKDLSGWAPML